MFRRGLLLVFLFIGFSDAFAQVDSHISSQANVKESLQDDTLQEVSITRQRDIPLSTTVSAQRLSSKDLESSNSLNVGDAIKGFNGVQIRDYGGIGGMKTIDVRNMGSKHTVVFYDGLAINDAQNGEIDLGKYSLDNLQSISLYHNNHQDIAQPAKAFAAASALYLESRFPVFSEGESTKVRAKVAGGSFGLINPALSIQQKLSDQASLSLNTEWTKAKGEYNFHYKNRLLLDTTIRRRNTDLESVKAEIGVQGLLQDSSEWRVNAYMYLSERGLPGPALNNNYYSQDRQDDKNMFVQGSWDKRFSERYRLRLSSKYSYNWMRYLDPTYNNEAKRLENFYIQKEVYFSAINVFQFHETLKGSLSADYLTNRMDANIVQFAYPKRNTGFLNAAMDYRDGRWRIQGNLLATFVNDQVKQGRAIDIKNALSPSLSLSFKPLADEKFFVRGSYKSTFRLPTFNDSYYTLIGSSSLKPEYAKEYNIGITFRQDFSAVVSTLLVKADAYHNRIRDRITAIPRTFRWTMMNVGRVKIEGIELGVQSDFDFNADWKGELSLNTAFQKGVDITPDGYYYGQDIPYSPRYTSSARFQLRYRSFGIGTSSIFSGAKYSGRENRPIYYLDEWFVQDLRLSYNFNVQNIQVKAFADINNFLNADYVIIENYPMPGRNYRASIHITF